MSHQAEIDLLVQAHAGEKEMGQERSLEVMANATPSKSEDGFVSPLKPILDLANVDADSAYHNWLERQRFTHSPEIEHAFREGWRILSTFIAGPEQKAVDWSIVCEAVSDAADIDGIGPKALESSFNHSGLLVIHRATGETP